MAHQVNQEVQNTKLWMRGIIIDIRNLLTRKEYNNQQILEVFLRQELVTSTKEQRETTLITENEKETLIEKITELAKDLYLDINSNTTYLGIINQIKEVKNSQDLFEIKEVQESIINRVYI